MGTNLMLNSKSYMKSYQNLINRYVYIVGICLLGAKTLLAQSPCEYFDDYLEFVEIGKDSLNKGAYISAFKYFSSARDLCPSEG